MLKEARKIYGFKELLVYQKTEQLQNECSLLTSHFPHSKTLSSLADQMNRSARSVKQNIVEGWKRNSTKEYYEFLGFSIGACAELEEDCNDIWKGIYPELKGEKGVPFDIEKIKFYPLDPTLPPIVKLKLRCKELNFLLESLQNSLENKMKNEGTMPISDKFKIKREERAEGERWEEKILEEQGLIKLENGKVVKNNKLEILSKADFGS